MLKAGAVLLAVLAVVVGVTYYHCTQVPDMPEMELNKWWGRGPKPIAEDTSIRPFKIEFNDTMIKDLKQRLKTRRPLTPTLEGIQSEYGINMNYLEKVLEYWQNEYDFNKRADLLNQFAHFKTRVQGLDLHFIRSTPAKKSGLNVLPLLVLHGWPSSSKEFDKLIPLLTTPKDGYDFVFDVVAVDLPGFGFSEGTNLPGLTPAQMGVIMRNLMTRLGFGKFYIQGGDWGSQVAAHMATMFQDDILGLHINMPISSMPISTLKLVLGAIAPTWVIDPKFADRVYPLHELMRYIMRESGYFHIQATKPDTIGASLTDSPTGLAAYLIEKMAICTNREQLDTPHGGLAALQLEDVLDTITIMWANNAIVTSVRIYAEGVSRWQDSEVNVLHKIPTFVPTAVINFKYEVLYQPDWVLRDKYRNLVHSTTLDFGGHFAALQTPEVFADDIFEATVEFLKFHSR